MTDGQDTLEKQPNQPHLVPITIPKNKSFLFHTFKILTPGLEGLSKFFGDKQNYGSSAYNWGIRWSKLQKGFAENFKN